MDGRSCRTGAVRHHIAAIRRGEIVEDGPTAEVFAAPKHEYTWPLFNSIAGRVRITGKEIRA